jgi:xanthine dehydrogenase accessory factor
MAMENADQQVLKQLTQWVSEGRPSWLCTVVKTWGSSPRPIGSLLACNSEGQIAGSLSGGCIEEDLLEKLQRGEMANAGPEVLVYGVSQAETERFGLPCGGQLHVVIEPFVDQHHLDTLRAITERIEQRACIERSLDITTGDMTLSETERFRHLHYDGAFDNTSGEKTLRQTFGPRYQLFLIGCGQVSQYLAEMAKALDYQVVVCDPRANLMEQWPVEGVQLITSYPDDAIRAQATDSFSAIIALTHDPRIDDMGLMEALTTDAYFIGAMGSTKTSENRKARLKELDISDDLIARLHAPVGLPIGSKTPAEIAIAILAQLTALRSTAGNTVQADFRAVG